MLDLTELPARFSETVIRLSRDIEFNKAITKGGNGFVLVGNNKILSRDVAVKFYYWGGGDHIEPALLSKFDCDQILKIFHAESITNEDAFFMTAFCSRGDLDDALEIRSFGPLEALDTLLQVAAGLSYMHGQRYLHRDLKPSNIFCLADGRFVIGDFGSVAPQDANGIAKTLTRHSLIYRPPEEILSKTMCKESDIYQIGLVFFQLLGGRLPYEEFAWLSDNERERYDFLGTVERQFYATSLIEKKIVKGKLVDLASLPCWVPDRLKSIIRKCCARKVKDRFANVSDLTAKLNNLRSSVPDWQIDEHPILIRKRKKYRIIDNEVAFAIEKNTGSGWRTERQYRPQTLAEAVKIAEAL